MIVSKLSQKIHVRSTGLVSKKCAHSRMSMLGIFQPLACGSGARQSSPTAVEEGHLLGCNVVLLCQKDGVDDVAFLLHVELESAR